MKLDSVLIHKPRKRLQQAFDNFFPGQIPPATFQENYVNCEGFTELDGTFSFSSLTAEGLITILFSHDGVTDDVVRRFRANTGLPTDVNGLRKLQFRIPIVLRLVRFQWDFTANTDGGVAPSDVSYHANLLP